MKNLKLTLLFMGIASFLAFTLTERNTLNNSNGYKVGDLAIDFNLKNIDGNQVSLSQFNKAKGFIIIFTCNSCPTSVANEDRIIALDKKYKGSGFPVIAINPNNPLVSPEDSYELMKVRAKQKKFTFPYLIDEKQEVYPLYGATRTPHVFILEKEKEGLIVRYIGSIDDSSRNPSLVKTKYAEKAVDALLHGKNIEVANTKAIGCSIKK